MKSLKTIGIDSTNKWPPAEFWKKYDAGEFGKRAAPAKHAYLDPAFQQWVKATQALPAEKQIEAVSKKLMELNPGFDGKLTGLVTERHAQDRERRSHGDRICRRQRDRYFAGAGVGRVEGS